MKKICKTLFVSTSICIVLLGGCGKNEPLSSEQAAMSSFIERAEAEMSKVSASKAETTTTAPPIEKTFEPCNEILNASIYSGKIQIEDSVFTFPILFQDFVKQGAVCSSDENYLIEAEKTQDVSFKINDTSISCIIRNISYEAAAIKDCVSVLKSTKVEIL